jgi:hypothetical protein
MSNEYTQFLRDFADANIDSFEDEQLHILRNAAREIENLIEERDLARREICRWEASATGKRITECAKLNEWDCFKNEKQHTYVCDHCGDSVDSNNVFFFHTLPQDIASANKGESATVCRKCCDMIDANTNNQEFRTTDMG